MILILLFAKKSLSMEDLNKSLCSFLFEMTNYPIKNLKEIKNGLLLSMILNKIDSEFFKINDLYNNWVQCKAILDEFLVQKGLTSHKIEFDFEEITAGSTESITNALLQIFTIMAVFNKNNWNEYISYLDSKTKTQINTITENLIEELECKTLKIKENAISLQEKTQVKALLIKLEKLENQLEESQILIKNLKNELLIQNKENVQKSHLLEIKQKEIQELNLVKDQLVEQMGNVIKEKSHFNEAFWKKKLQTQNFELEKANKRIDQLNTVLIEKDDEISKKDMNIAVLLNKESQLVETIELLNECRHKNEELKKEYDIRSSKLIRSNFDLKSKIANDFLNSQLIAEKDQSSKVKSEVNLLKNKNSELKKKLENFEIKIQSHARKSISNFEHNAQISGYLNTIRDYQTENQRNKNLIEKLKNSNNFEQIKNIFTEFESEKQFFGFKDLISIVEENTDEKRANFKRKSSIKIEQSSQKPFSSLTEIDNVSPVLIHLESQTTFESKSVKKIESGENKSNNAAYLIIERASKLLEEGDSTHILYSVLMAYQINELNGKQALVLSNESRKRDIFNHFTLSTYVNSLI